MYYRRELSRSSELNLSIRCKEWEIFGKTFGKYESSDYEGVVWERISRAQYVELRREFIPKPMSR